MVRARSVMPFLMYPTAPECSAIPLGLARLNTCQALCREIWIFRPADPAVPHYWRLRNQARSC